MTIYAYSLTIAAHGCLRGMATVKDLDALLKRLDLTGSAQADWVAMETELGACPEGTAAYDLGKGEPWSLRCTRVGSY